MIAYAPVMHRLFVAIQPPQHVLDVLADQMEGVASLRWQDIEQLHITLRFIGEVERPLAEDIAAALGALRFGAFQLRVEGVGRFDHGRRGTLWAGVWPPVPVAALAVKVERACVGAGIGPERRAFHPHITLARWSQGPGLAIDRFLAAHAALRSEAFVVDCFNLYESHLGRQGAHHELVATYPLTG